MDTPQNQSHSSHRICGCFLCRLIKYFWNCGCFLCRLPKYFWNCGCFLCRLPKYFWHCGCFLCKYFWNCGCLLCRLTKYFWNCGCFLCSLTKYFWNCGCFLCILTEYFWNCSRSRSRSRSRAIEGTGISSPSAIEGIQTSPIDANEAAKDDFDADHLKSLAGLPTNFSFQTLETATGSFSKEIGRGGFGKVYEGILTDGTQVAVKCLLNQTGHGQREFCAEILTISGLNHSNLVSLRGMCVEGPHRILVYEFMPNGSLDKWLFASDIKLDWKTRYSIALDTARGLAYLHEDSIRGILHLDVKPQNILLDENFKAKVSDFGMARSLKRDLESRVVTAVRGTPGYMAPEWFVGWGITYKADVFSYGMVLLEIIRGSKNVDHSQDSENWYFPSVAFKKARQGKMDELIESGLKLKRPQEMDEAYRLIKTALWCIQSNSAMRPSMATVVRLLEGDIELMDPPLACTLPFAPSLDDDETPPDLDC